LSGFNQIEENYMKIKLTAIAVLLSILFFAGCGASSTGFTGSENVTMGSIDTYLGRDARYIDLRDFKDFFNTGYIAGFEAVPFFQFLEGRALVRNTGWDFTSADIQDKAVLENVFGPKDGMIILMCGSGTRAGYVKAALDSIGYTKVVNAGGIRDYSGKNKILGDGEFGGVAAITGEVTMENIDNYMARPGSKYLDLRNVADPYVSGYIDGFEVISFFEYLDGNALVRNNGWEFSEADIKSKIILENIFGAKDREVFLMCGSGTRAGYVKSALEAIGYSKVYNVGGIRDYQGEHKILGDESFTLTLQ
jgi:rhodanese-related sulfurtransferase